MSQSPYRVLARKYRPQSFAELIGQDAMVTTLANAIERDRLAHAYLLTGVRGVGKTTTARLIAKALNCVGPDGTGGPTISPCNQCEPCRAIAEARSLDVIEMDAASNTKVEQMRDLLDGVPYATMSARYRIYIIDEVHMLSNSSFNALLKTLEEPPAHVKFIFATTEVGKLPVTVLSRCQRFDLRRIPAERLAQHYAEVAKAEEVSAEPEALALVARAAEGSARDGLSILDQAIAHGAGSVTADAVRDMLGLADRGQIRALFAHLLAGEGAQALAALRALYDLGADPATALTDLLELTHAITRAKASGEAPAGVPEDERDAIARWADALTHAQLHRLWQLLLKGLSETRSAPQPIQAAEMALLRLIHASSLPDPGELVRRLNETEPAAPAPAPPAPARHPRATPEPALVAAPPTFEALIALFEERREPGLAACLHDAVRPVRYAPPALDLAPAGELPRDFSLRLSQCLERWTGTRWRISLTEQGGEPTMREREASARAAILGEPLVKAVMDAFPGAELIDYEAHPETARAQTRQR